MLDITKQSLTGTTFIDLFAGLGGFRLALESFGAKCVFSSEWEPNVQKVYADNFGDLPMGDITMIHASQIPNHDILCAGFPCQPFSISGKQQGFRDNRGTLFFDVARIVRYHKPKVVFMENVKNFAKHNNGNTLKLVKDVMESLDYTFYPMVLNGADFGIPQKRERIYMVCFRKDLNITDFSFPAAVPLQKHVEDCLLPDTDIPEALYVSRPDTYMQDKTDTVYGRLPIRLGTVNKGGQGERIYSTKGIAITLSANGGGIFSKTGGYLVHDRIRKLHPRECARLMGYPDSYRLDANFNRAYTQLGNSVIIDVLQYIILEIGRCLPQTAGCLPEPAPSSDE